MEPTRRSPAGLAMVLGLCIAAVALWWMHAQAWGTGRRSPVLNFDASQYALAARELAQHGRLQTPFALPLELDRHATPPWPLAVLQPGLVLAEAAVFKLAPPHLDLFGRRIAEWRRPNEIEWLALAIPFTCFLLTASVLGLGASKVLRRSAALDRGPAVLAGLAVGLAFVLDAEAQHFATGGFTEMPFTLGLVGALALLALGGAAKRPLAFGVLLGLAGAFRGNMAWLVPAFALAVAASAPPGRRLRGALLSTLGWAVMLAPWWLYKWRMFGTPAWDLSALAVWEGVGGRTWFSLVHLPEMPNVPHGLEAVRLLAAKCAYHLPRLLLGVLTGPRALWLGALVVYAGLRDTRPELRAAARLALAALALNLLVASVGVPLSRYLFPARVIAEAAGLLATLALLARLPQAAVGPGFRRLAMVAVALLALGWGVHRTRLGLAEARVVSQTRGLPDTVTLLGISVMLQRELPPGEPVMSNLGPNLAWYSGRPVVHLALTPDDIEACRRRLDVRHVVVAFRDAEHAWPGWGEVVARPLEALHRPEWNVAHARAYASADGFTVVWLELGPLVPRLARATAAGGLAAAVR